MNELYAANTYPSARRVAAARRAVKREIESVALFPELARWKTPKERIEAMDSERVTLGERLAAIEAEEAHDAVVRWNALPDDLQERVAEKWNRIYRYGGRSAPLVYFLELIGTTAKVNACLTGGTV
jgi:hypothetical protein